MPVGNQRVIYRSGLTDSSRWDGFVLRPDDIVISTPSKCGTTWLQMICALLVFGSPDLPGSLAEISPWLDMRARPIPDVLAELNGQHHRRIIKTHTPLDGLPRADGVTYLVCGRDPREVGVSMVRHLDNLDTDRITALLTPGSKVSQRPPTNDSAEVGVPDVRERVLAWLADDRVPEENLSSLKGTVWHLAEAWNRQGESGIVLLHYADLMNDRAGVMHSIAASLGIEIAPEQWPILIAAAGMDQMRERADTVTPEADLGFIKDRRLFFRGDSGATWGKLLGPDDLQAYQVRVRSLSGGNEAFVDWLHHGSSTGSGADGRSVFRGDGA